MANRKKDIVKMMQSMSAEHAPYEIFRDWVKMCALAIVNSTSVFHGGVYRKREEEYLSTLKKYNEADQRCFPEMFSMLVETMGEEFGDVLGEIYMESCMGNKGLGQFFTPFHLSELCARLSLPEDGEKMLINEPSCGGGGMIIATAAGLKEKDIDYQRVMEVVAQDLDWNSVYMCYVQLSLYDISAIVCQCDTICDPDPSRYPKNRIFKTPRKAGMIIGY